MGSEKKIQVLIIPEKNMPKLIECVPNFSEGRRPEVIDAICEAITSVDGVVLLDKEMDRDHNRAVVTFVSHPDNAVEAAFRGYQKAAELIDMTTHKGEHPRMGACDVCPFIPISDVSIEDAIELANKLGKRVGEELQIPVYLYEDAATSSKRKNLANVRQGEHLLCHAVEDLRVGVIQIPLIRVEGGPHPFFDIGEIGECPGVLVGEDLAQVFLVCIWHAPVRVHAIVILVVLIPTDGF